MKTTSILQKVEVEDELASFEVGSVVILTKHQFSLAEGPVWNADRNSVIWVDILANKVCEKKLFSSSISVWVLSETPSSLSVDAKNSNIVWIITERSLASLNLQSGELAFHIKLPFEDGYRSNDGAVSSDGRYWYGTMKRSPEQHCGKVYSIGSHLDVRCELDGVAIPNTFCWSNDGYMLISDSMEQQCDKYLVTEYGLKKTSVFYGLSGTSNTPDGGAIDEEGNLWLAIWGGRKIICISQHGVILQEIELPAIQPTSCCFGGIDNNILFVTSAAEGVEHLGKINSDRDGCLFAIVLPVKGAPVNKFGRFEC